MFLLFLILQLTSVKFYARVIFFHLNFFYVSVIVFIASPSIKAIKRWNKECCDEKFGLVGEKMKNVPTKVLMRSRALLQASEKLELAITHALSLLYTHTHTLSQTHTLTPIFTYYHRTNLVQTFIRLSLKKDCCEEKSRNKSYLRLFFTFKLNRPKTRLTIHKNA
jgi:hypothetical protein